MSETPIRSALDRLRARALERPDLDVAPALRAIGERVAERRSELRLSQRELAELCATTQSAIARLEGGRRAPRIDTLLRIADALDSELVLQLRPRTTREEP